MRRRPWRGPRTCPGRSGNTACQPTWTGRRRTGSRSSSTPGPGGGIGGGGRGRCKKEREGGMIMRLTKLAVSGLKNQRGEYALAPLTIFSGPNGAGKTGALQAVMFGVAGYEPRLGKSAEKLAPLMSGDELSVRLTAENGGRGPAVTPTPPPKNRQAH